MTNLFKFWKIKISWQHAIAFALLVFLALAAGGNTVSAHATLTKTEPNANDRLKSSPPQIELTFNEAVEPGAGSLEVVDSHSRKVTDQAPKLSADRTTLQLALPALDDGVYTVMYRIVSEDGHPVSGSYAFVVGNPPGWKDGSTFIDAKDTGGGLSSGDWLIYTIRILYYASLLIAAGLMAWSALYRNPSESVRNTFRRLTLLALRVLLISILVFVFLQVREVMAGQPLSKWGQYFTGTATGRAWLEMIVLALAGFAVQRAPQFLRLLWPLLILGVESLIGHAAANDPRVLTIAMDFIHLAAAALWAGGLLPLVVLWFEDRKEAGRFAASFSKGALISLIVLVVSGVMMTMLFLPKLSYLWLTPWGILLTIKTAATVLVLATGAWLRVRMKRSGMPDGKLLRVDLALMLVIVALAAIFTYISPLPSNAPVRHHVMGEDMHYTLSITPNVPGGDNEVTLQIWLPVKDGAPKSAVLRLRSEGRADQPIEVPLELFDDQSYDTFEGFVRTSYRAKGPFLPYADKWKAEIRIMTKDDFEKPRDFNFENY
ncbi:copper resistance CopC/CopD family protein [Paenibacillus sp. NPDC058071]|uniref:copper resistance CopC/CopD family protein n=1 Tax=Paenibacillus sp. NPDC058071 TaxID=3346326 RepID=UPI0036DD48A3